MNTNGIELSREDCMDLMARCPDTYFDLAVTDPPYFNGPNRPGYYGHGWYDGHRYHSSTGIVRKNYPQITAWDSPGIDYFRELTRVSKGQIIWGINYFYFGRLGPGRIVWDKCNGTAPFNDCEIAYNSLTTRTDLIRYMWNGMLQGKNCKDGSVPQGDKSKIQRRIHPTEKPIALYKWLLSRYAKPGMKILDTHLGSGSIAIACLDLGFSLTACEINEHYFNAALERIRLHTSQMSFDFTAGREPSGRNGQTAFAFEEQPG
jgi:site-specific DNA-methyltransferase (adenine-specific)